ncbi:hypothetical protein CMQ_6202 [Grosmannia clavigera kw1407]|uniref:Uncharacterized protein n=1 Tax=Grosmannia clavigera (strain kw1407 / UAMH 11150) TaxID=655863 RepID=F0XMJ4_GROCL|nr:uncharacterized protein CMQ_6202 [Grosmannia clavigera kw1407]EFX01260.1 hypothetical protein CMQ_6202 [Grosmannia clavigera kw1407]
MRANYNGYIPLSKEMRIRSWLAGVPDDPELLAPVLEPFQEYDGFVSRSANMQKWPELSQWGVPGSPGRWNKEFGVFQATLPTPLEAAGQITDRVMSTNRARPKVPIRSPKRPIWRPL